MGNAESSTTSLTNSNGNHHGSKQRRSASSKNRSDDDSYNTLEEPDDVAARAQKVVGASVRELQAGIAHGMKKLEEASQAADHPVTGLLDTVCGAYMGAGDGDSSTIHTNATTNNRNSRRGGGGRGGAGQSLKSYSDEASDTYYSEEETTVTTDYRSKQRRRNMDEADTIDESYVSTQSTEYDDSTVPDSSRDHRHHGRRNSSRRGRKFGRHRTTDESSYESEDDEGTYDEDDTYTQPSRVTTATSNEGDDDNDNNPTLPSTTQQQQNPPDKDVTAMLARQPLASSFAKRCYFTKAGIGGHTQHYEGLTLTGNVVLMLAQAMKLKGCPTICDEDLRRVEQTYPNQFSRLPDELLLSSGWRRISKYCHFSHKPIPDGIPFFRELVACLFIWLVGWWQALFPLLGCLFRDSWRLGVIWIRMDTHTDACLHYYFDDSFF